ncbi:hypothetical protein [Caulobacter hibisci]|uniref:Uncharacterized protein n=1 Tax=Caulobacter hibisci TaxID=2035993 RepID=A0ABS0SWV3_9CAUL|nr:hypothetical protein [Caulobacter hibisci]MBI1684068.1 hypothetical protein [Caulobacter hibisci]
MTRSAMSDRLWALARPLAWTLVAVALTAPAIAMRLTPEVHWTALDFAAAAILLIGGGLACEVFAWRVRSRAARIAFSLGVVAVVGLIWGAAIN